MDKNAIKKYAVWAREELIERVSQKAYQYEISADADPNADSAHGVLLNPLEKKQRVSLINKVKDKGMDQVIEEVAYTWFNRFAALRFMEVNNYLPSRVRVFTDEEGAFKPEILTEAIHLELKGLDMEKVYALKETNDDEALFKYLIIAQCNALSSVLPGMFQKIADYTELLFPDNLLREGSVVERMVTQISEDNWKDQVQIIGWLYQYYNTEPKDKVFADLKKNKKITKDKIPAATQLFTPDWIVRYMVENSLGRLWIEGHPNDDLKANWKYYLGEAEQTPEVAEKLRVARSQPPVKSPEDIRLIDPCMGSGHILVYAFDVLMQIYESEGYNPRDAAKLILEKNIYGLDIDCRAYQLTYFSLMMKARQYNRRIFTEDIKPQVYYPAGYPEGEEYGSLVKVDKLEPMPELPKEQQMTLFDGSYDTKLNVWNFKRLLAQKYDVVVTNPPYMGSSGMSAKLSDFVKKNYPDSKSDTFSAFIERCGELLTSRGFQSMITMESWMFLSSFENLRKKLFSTQTIINMVHMPYLGKGGTSLGINFGTAAFIISKAHIKNYAAQYDYICYYETDDDGIPLEFPTINERYKASTVENFEKIPGQPVAYWVSETIQDIFHKNKKIDDIANPRQGLATGNNDHYLRFWVEVVFSDFVSNCDNLQQFFTIGAKYVPYNKGGAFRKWYGNIENVIRFDKANYDMLQTVGNHLPSKEFYFKESITWSKVTSGGFSMRYVPKGSVFDVAGCSIFSDSRLKYLLGLSNSVLMQYLMNILSQTLNYEVGSVKSIPIIFDCNLTEIVERTVNQCISLSRNDWDTFETSWDFQRHPLIRNTRTIREAFTLWQSECDDRFNQLKANEEELNRSFIDIYGLQDELTPEEDDKDVTVRRADLGRDIRSFVSYAVGCMMGRYSLDVDGLAYGGGDWDDSKYKTFIPDKDAIIPITDDEYFKDDIVGRFVDFVRTVYGTDTLEENLKFIADALGEKGSTSREVIRNYFLNDFYKDHCKIYQKRPFYWLFDSGKKNGFKCLVYMHRYQPDTIARIRTDYVHEQQARYRTAIEGLERQLTDTSTSERVKINKQLTKLKDQAEETRKFEEKIHHLADQMIKIDLDDGVKHNYEIFKDVLAKIK